ADRAVHDAVVEAEVRLAGFHAQRPSGGGTARRLADDAVRGVVPGVGLDPRGQRDRVVGWMQRARVGHADVGVDAIEAESLADSTGDKTDVTVALSAHS